MADFLFDLQRFATYNRFSVTVNNTEKFYDHIQDRTDGVLNDKSLSNTFTVIAKKSYDGLYPAFTIPSGKNVTIHFYGYSYAKTGDTNGITISSGATATFTGNASTAIINNAVTNSGTLTLSGMRLYRTLTNNSGCTVNIVNNTANSTPNDFDITGSGTFNIVTMDSDSGDLTTLASFTVSGTSGTPHLNTDTSGTTKITLNGATLTDTTDSSNNIVISGNVSFAYDSGGSAQLTGFTDGKSFKIKRGSGTEITYTVSGNRITATNGTLNKIWQKSFTTDDISTESVSLSDLEFDNDFSPSYPITKGDLVIPPTATIDDGDYIIVGSDDGKVYGTITQSGTNYSVTKTGADDGATLTAATISNSATVTFASGFVNVPITVKSDSATKAVFTATTADSTFTVNNNDTISASGVTELSLTNGTFLTTGSQTITSGNYKISDYTDAQELNDGITITYGTSTKSTVGDIDAGEKFTVDSTVYEKTDFGLMKTVSGAARIYVGEFADENKTSVDLSNLTAANFKGLIAPADGVLELGTTNTVSAVVVDNTTSPSAGYADLTVSSKNYTLEAYDSGEVSAFSTISAADDITLTVDASLGKNKTITNSTTNFIVTDTGTATNFIVGKSNSVTTVTNATAITLNSGKISAAAGQTITIDNLGKTLAVGTTGSVVVELTDTGFTATASVNGTNKPTFTVDGTKTYTVEKGTVDLVYASTGNTTTIALTATNGVKIGENSYSVAGGSDGISLVDDGSKITVTGIETVGESFTIDSYTYTLTDIGLVRNGYLWTGAAASEGLSVDDLTAKTSTTWKQLVTCDGTITIDDSSVDCVLADSGNTKTYGELTSDNGVFTLKRFQSDTGDTALTKITVTGAKSLLLTKYTDTGTNYAAVPVTLSNGTVTYNDKKISGTVKTFTAGDMIFEFDSSDAFTIDENSYEMKGAGLTRLSGTTPAYIWSTPNATATDKVTQYDLSAGGTWSKVYTLADSALTLTSDTPESDNIIVDNNTYATRLAQLIYTSSGESYVFKKIGTNSIATINLPKGDLSVTTDFAANLVTDGKGTVTANEKVYKGTTALTVAADAKNSSKLYAGTVTISAGDTVTTGDTTTANTALAVTSGEITATADAGEWTTFALDDGDVFTVDNSTTYEVRGTKTLIQRDSSNGKLYMPNLDSGQITFANLKNAANFRTIVPLTSSGALDLTSIIDGTTIVTNYGDPTIRVGDLTYSTGSGYSFKKRGDGNTSALTEIQLSTSAAVLSTDIVTAVNTNGNTEYKINGKTFDAQSNLTIVTPTASTAYLTEGTIALAAGKNVTTRRTDSINHDETIAATEGNMTVTANGSGNLVTLGALEAGTAFTVDGTKFTMTNVGLALTDKTKLNPNVTTSVTTTDLTGDDFKTVMAAKDGVVTITSTTAANVVLADLSDVTTAKYYGTLTKKSGLYTLSGNTALQNITVTGTKITLPAVNQNATIVTDAATFTVDATNAFTVDATKGLSITNADAVNLTKGSVSTNVPVNAGGYEITAGNNTDITVNFDDKVTVTGIDNGESFTVDGVTYTLTAAGLYDATNKQIVTAGYSDGTFTPDDAETGNVIAPTGTALDLTAQKSNAFVYDSVTNPKTKLATLTTGSQLKLVGEETASAKIKTITVPADSTVTVDFATKISAPAGSITVNGVNFEATTAVILDSDGKTATLYTGTVALDSATPTVTADATVTVVEGEFTVTAANGKFTTLDGLDAGESFKLDDTTYTHTALGLMTGSTLATGLTGTTISVPKISTAKWYNLIGLTNGVLDLSQATVDSLVVDSVSAPTTRLGTVTVNGSVYTVDFATQVSAPAGSVTVNGVNFVGTGTIILDATAKTATLNTGTVTVDGTVNATDDTISGTGFNATAANGKFTQLSNLDAGDTFTYGGKTYTQSALGLVTGSTIATSLAGNTIDPAKISSAKWENFTAPTNGVLDLTDAITAVVVDSTTNPTTILGNLMVDGSRFTVDYATKVKTASGTVTVNGVTYNATTELILDATPTTSTLNTGTVTTSGTVTSTNDTLTINSGTVNATAADGKFTTLTGLDVGESFTYGGKTYTQTALGLRTGDTIRQDLTSTTLDLSKLDGGWENYLVIDGELDLPQEISGTTLLVSEDFTKIYGELSATDGVFSLTKPSAATETLTAINISGAAAELAADFANVLLTAGDAKISSITLKSKNRPFTVDATSTPNLSGNVTAFALAEGTVAAENQTVTAGANTVVATNAIIISPEEISAIDVGDNFTLNGKIYRLVNETVGLFNSTDGKLVTGGFDGDTLTIADIEETPIIAPTNEILDLTRATESSIVVDSTTNPTTILGNLTVDGDEFTVDYATKVKTLSGTVTVNGVIYNATTELILDATPTTSTLNTGTVTTSGTVTATNDTLTVNSGTVNATAADGKFTTLTGLDVGESFTYGGKTYTQTALGLRTGDTIRQDLTASTLDLSKLDGGWENYLIINGEIDLPQEISGTTLLVSDDFTKIYGELNSTDGVFSLTKPSAATETLTAINISGAAAELAADFANVLLTAGDAKISSITLKNKNRPFTVDATSTPNLSGNVTAFALAEGTVAAENQTVTAGANTVVASSAIVVSPEEISAIDVGDNFTLNGKIYRLVNETVGLFNSTDGKLVTGGFDGGTLTIADIEETPIIAPTNEILDLTKATESSIVVDSTTNPTTILGNLTVEGDEFTVDYATKVKTASGTVTVNGVTYNATTELILDATPTTSTLNTGTVTTSGTINATNDTLTVNSGTVNATAADGKFTTLTGLDVGESFTYGGKTYTQTALGLRTGDTIRQDLTSTTLDLSKLDGGWENYLIINGELDLPQEISGTTLLVSEDFTKIYGELSATDGNFSLTKPSAATATLISITINDTTVEISSDFKDIPLTIGDAFISAVTIKGKSFTVDATGDVPSLSEDVTVFTLEDGTVAAENQTVTAGANTVVASSAIVVSPEEISAIDAGDNFTLNGKIYRLVNETVGLFNSTDSKLVTGGFDGDTLTIADIEETPIIAPTNEILDLTRATESSIVVDSTTNPTTILGNLMVDGDEFTVDYATKVKTASGTVTVNGVTYNATTELILDSDGSTSTLNTGTVTLEGGDSVTSSDETEVTVNSGEITVKASDGAITVSGLSDGDDFAINGTEYVVSAAGIINDSGELWTGKSYSGGLTPDELSDESNWSQILAADGGIVTVNADSLSDGETVLLVDDPDNPTQIFGTLTKTDDKYTLTAGDDLPDAIEISDAIVDVDGALSAVPITAGDAEFTATAANKFFTVDATEDYPIIDAAAVQLESGAITAKDGAHRINDKNFTVANAEAVNIDADLTVSAIPAGGQITVDGQTYTAPEDDSTLTYNEDDGWFFDGYVPEIYNVTVNRNGIVSVDTGIKFSDVVASDKIISDEIELVGVKVPVKITTAIPLTVTAGGEKLAEIVSATGSVTFSEDGISVDGTARLNLSGDATLGGVKITGTDEYTATVTDNTVTALSGIGSGVTVSGLGNATIQTDEEGTLTVDKTFTANSGVTYTVTGGKISAADNVTQITGDFSNGVKINGTSFRVYGGSVTINSDGTVETAAGSRTINGHMFNSTVATTFQTRNGTVTGAQLSGDGELTIYQNETNFTVNNDTLTLTGNKTVILSVEGGTVTEAIGVTGTIAGLKDATVYDIARATINGTALKLTEADAIVEDGTVIQLVDVPASSTITTAPSLTLTSAENGAFTFGQNVYNIFDTVDGSVDFITDAYSQVTEIENFAGALSGDLTGLSVNGNEFSSNSPTVTLNTDGDIITRVSGLTNGSSVSGDLDDATFVLPHGSVTIQGNAYATDGGSDIELTGNTITGLQYGDTVTVGTAGEYEINGESVTAHAGNAYSTNRDGVFLVETNHLPITDKTPVESIPADVTLVESDSSLSTGDGVDSVIVRNGANAVIDVAEGNPTLIAISGSVTLQNYDDNVDIQTFEYTDVNGAIMRGDVKFGDGKMTIGDAVVTFDENAYYSGDTEAALMNARGDRVRVAFTHTAGGTADVSDSTDNYFLKGNYAANSSDTQKSAASTLTGGSGNDTLLVGAGDLADGGEGNNQIYVTDPALRDAGATIILSRGQNTVHNFNDGLAEAADKIQIRDLDALEYGYGSGGLTLQSGNAELTFDDNETDKIKLTDGRNDYDAQFAPDDEELVVDEALDLFFGNENGINFGEYDGTVAVNLNDSTANMDGTVAQMRGIEKVTAGPGNSTLTGANGVENTLAAGTGNVEMYSGRGNDLLLGYTGDDKTGSATFHYTSGYGSDTIRNFDFMAGEGDTLSDEIFVDTSRNVITDIHLDGSDVVIGINGSSYDNLTIADAKGKHMLFSGIVGIVDDELTYDGYTDCYAGGADNSTLTVGEGFDLVDICMGREDDGTQFIGKITVLDATNSDGITALVGNELNNLIIGGKGENSIWGGDGTNDTLVGGSGKNTFYFNLDGGNDIIQEAHDGDVVEFHGVNLENIGSADIENDGVVIELLDGSKVNVQSTAAVEYKLADGSTYTANHETGDWERKE